jgi:hypothetical protein
MANKTAKKKPMVKWKLDVDFYSFDIEVRARTKGEARKKAMAKLKKTNVAKYINKNCTYLDKVDDF